MNYRVVFHLDEDEDPRVVLVINNIRNLRLDLGEGDIEVVAYARGVNALMKNSRHREVIGMLIKEGVKFSACSNTLKGMGISADDLIDGVEVVSSGVGEIVKRQMDGWAYVRP